MSKLDFGGYTFESEKQADDTITYLLEMKYGIEHRFLRKMDFGRKRSLFIKKAKELPKPHQIHPVK
jgi:hypothetical protein